MKKMIGIILIFALIVLIYKISIFWFSFELLNDYFETKKTGYTWNGVKVYEHKNCYSPIFYSKYFCIFNKKLYEFIFIANNLFYKKSKKDIKVNPFSISPYHQEYGHSYNDFDLNVYVMKVFDFGLSLNDTLKYNNKIYNKILTQKFCDVSSSDTLYYFVSEQPLESENYPFKESYLVSESKGLVATMLVNESTTPIQVRFLRGNWNYNLYKGKKIRIKHTVKKEENYEMESIDIKQIPAFKKECFWQK